MKPIEIQPGVKWEDLLQQAKTEDVVLLQNGHAVALLSDFDDDDLEWFAQERDPAFLSSLARAREQVAKGQVISHEDLKKQLSIS